MDRVTGRELSARAVDRGRWAAYLALKGRLDSEARTAADRKSVARRAKILGATSGAAIFRQRTVRDSDAQIEARRRRQRAVAAARAAN